MEKNPSIVLKLFSIFTCIYKIFNNCISIGIVEYQLESSIINFNEFFSIDFHSCVILFYFLIVDFRFCLIMTGNAINVTTIDVIFTGKVLRNPPLDVSFDPPVIVTV